MREQSEGTDSAVPTGTQSKEKAMPLKTKLLKRKMSLTLSAKRSGAQTESIKIDWEMPEAKALAVYARLHAKIYEAVRAEGLLK